MDSPDTIDLFFLKSYATLAQRSQPNIVTDYTKMLDTFTMSQGREKFYSPLHDSDCQVRIDFDIPVTLLVTTT